jgi:phosphoribosylformylglycinamidine cyclo-ligase
MSLYAQRGVSAQKEEVHQATEKLDKGIYPNAFCKIYPDHLCGDPGWVNVMHADGAGTKSILAYLYWKETGDMSVWKGIARDAIAMNLDDLLCAGIYDNLLFSSTIDRNLKNIPGDGLWRRHPVPRRRDGRCRRCGPDDHRERDDDRQVAKGPIDHQ